MRSAGRQPTGSRKPARGSTGRALEVAAAWSEAAACVSEDTLAELQALPSSEADRARLDRVYSLLEQQTDVLHELAAAASAGEAARVTMLRDERARLHRKEVAVLGRLGKLGKSLLGCPLALPG